MRRPGNPFTSITTSTDPCALNTSNPAFGSATTKQSRRRYPVEHSQRLSGVGGVTHVPSRATTTSAFPAWLKRFTWASTADRHLHEVRHCLPGRPVEVRRVGQRDP